MRIRLGNWLGILLLLLAPTAHAEGVWERATARGSLIAAAVPDKRPLAAQDAHGKLIGFDIEVAEEIAKRLDLPLTFVTPGWETILAGNWDGKWDYSVSNITPTEARSKVLDFPIDYRFEAVVVVVHRDNTAVTSPAEVSGKDIGVAEDTTFEKYLEHDLDIDEGEPPPVYLITDPQIRPYRGKARALLALAEGDGVILDAVVTSYATAHSAIVNGAPLRIVPGFLFWEPVAVAVDKGDPAFAERITAAVEAIKADGTLDRLSIKWFDIDMTDPMMP